MNRLSRIGILTIILACVVTFSTKCTKKEDDNNLTKLLEQSWLLWMLGAPGAEDAKAYHTYESIVADTQNLAQKYPNIAKLYNLGKTHQGRDIWAVKISDNVATDETEPVVYIDGGTHGSEWIGSEAAYNVLNHLTNNYGIDAAVTNMVDNAEIWIVPMLNPDGHARVRGGNFESEALHQGRKNGRDNGDGTIGVDPNRNFDYNWSKGTGKKGGSVKTSSRYYQGPSPFSEPESMAVRDLLLANPPRTSIHFHSFAQTIPYPYGNGNAALDAEIVNLANGISDAIKSVNGITYQPVKKNSNAGGAGWVYSHFSVPAFTIELRPSSRLGYGFALPASEIQKTLNESLQGVLYMINWAMTHP